MLVLCKDLFVSHPDVLKQWQTKFKYILVDEFQDINRVQYDVIRMLALPEIIFCSRRRRSGNLRLPRS